MDLMLQLDQEMAKRVQAVDQFVDSYLSDMPLPKGAAIAELRDSMKYSATNGGKRFRPVLSLLIADLFNCPVEQVLPFATAVEFIHTYSLIHDDLPSMDNDDVRRGKPTNHKVYGEAFALLAGDSLLTEAFMLIAKNYSSNGFLVGKLTELLSEAAGIRGMVGGQAIDLKAEGQTFSIEELVHLHRLKTGALIRVSVEGAAVIAGAKPSDIESLKKFGEDLGLAFQVADDILDHGEKDQDFRSFTGILGLEGTKTYLEKLGAETLSELRKVSVNAPLLEYLVGFNQSRKV
ncbi:Farnesyl diphosphate synthase [compost metagenome]